MAMFELKAPLDGVILPLEQVPDPVFSQKMVGDGISIDPTSEVLCAPCDGTVSHVHRAGHAVTLTTTDGLELMMHIGLDTVELKGEGFTPQVEEGQIVKSSDPLITFNGDERTQPTQAPGTSDNSADVALAPRSSDPNLLLGVAASAGLGVGKVFQLRRQKIHVEETGESPDQERRRLNSALGEARLDLKSLQDEVSAQADAGKAAIFAAHQELLDDPDLSEMAESYMCNGKSAAFAWQVAYTTHAQKLEQLNNELIAARAVDLRDVGERVLCIITGQSLDDLEIPVDSILIAEELTPSDTVRLDPERVRGFCTVGGGATSHVAILAQALGIPAVVGIEPRVLELDDAITVVLDGSKGQLRLNPGEAEILRIGKLKKRLEVKQKADLAAAHQPATTTAGSNIDVAANIGNVHAGQEAELAVAATINVGQAEAGELQPRDRDPDAPQKAQSILAALGGTTNVKLVEACAKTRIRVTLEDASMLNESALRAAGVEGIMHFKEGVSHLLLGLNADQYGEEMCNALN